MPHSESRTYPSPLRDYIASLEADGESFVGRWKTFSMKKSPTTKRKKKRRPNGHNEGQLTLSFMTKTLTPTKSPSNLLRKRDQMANFQDILNRPSEEIK